MAINGDDASLIGAFISTFLYGVYVVVAIECSRLLWQRHKERRTHTFLVVTHCLLLVLLSIRCISVASRATYERRHTNGGVIGSGNYDSAWGLIVNVPWTLSIIVSDTFLIYRVFIVWKRNFYVIIIPILLLLADIGSGFYMLWTMGTYQDEGLFHSEMTVSTMLVCSITVTLNLMCTGLIAYSILQSQRAVAHTKIGNSMTRVVTLVVESAAIWTLFSLGIIITLATGTYANYIFMDLCSPTIGIVFGSIIIRVSSGRSHGDDSGPTSAPIKFQGHPRDVEASAVHLTVNTCRTSQTEQGLAHPEVIHLSATSSDSYTPVFMSSAKGKTY